MTAKEEVKAVAVEVATEVTETAIVTGAAVVTVTATATVTVTVTVTAIQDDDDGVDRVMEKETAIVVASARHLLQAERKKVPAADGELTDTPATFASFKTAVCLPFIVFLPYLEFVSLSWCGMS